MEGKYLLTSFPEPKITDGVLGQKSDWRMFLNNYLQGRYGHTKYLTWTFSQSGPKHDIRWLAIAYYNGIEYGKGMARDRGSAMEIAAETTYRALTSYQN
ncbi:hypothetical protein HD554DRAFT_392986 [Boletus coccyginus]|nr:hypothetical protein HD554DRAFT_392986 [Boletus coccyginus]